MTKKQRLIAQILLLFILLFLFVRPQALRLHENWVTRLRLQAKVNKLEIKLNQLNGLEPNLIENRVKQMEAVFPSVKPIVPLIASLSRLAAESELSFGGLSLSPGSLSGDTETGVKGKKAAKTDDLKDLSFGFEIGGDFNRISQFLQALENTAPLMKIEEVGLTIKTNPLFDREQTMVVAQIKVAAYYQAPPEILGAIDKPLVLLNRDQETLLNQLVSFKTYPAVIPTGEVGKPNLFE